MSNPTSRRTRKLPAVQPVRIAEWKKQRGIEDFPGGIVPHQMTSATVYPFRHPKQLYGGLREGELSFSAMIGDWPEENIFPGDEVIVRVGPVQVGQLIKLKYKGVFI